jgi:hypothetical protein
MSLLPGALSHFPQNATCASQRTLLTSVNDAERGVARTEVEQAHVLTP